MSRNCGLRRTTSGMPAVHGSNGSGTACLAGIVLSQISSARNATGVHLHQGTSNWPVSFGSFGVEISSGALVMNQPTATTATSEAAVAIHPERTHFCVGNGRTLAGEVVTEDAASDCFSGLSRNALVTTSIPKVSINWSRV